VFCVLCLGFGVLGLDFGVFGVRRLELGVLFLFYVVRSVYKLLFSI
jgi:hypothetical protein